MELMNQMRQEVGNANALVHEGGMRIIEHIMDLPNSLRVAEEESNAAARAAKEAKRADEQQSELSKDGY